MFDKYPEQKQARKWVGAFGVALLGLVLLANEKQFAKTITPSSVSVTGIPSTLDGRTGQC